MWLAGRVDLEPRRCPHPPDGGPFRRPEGPVTPQGSGRGRTAAADGSDCVATAGFGVSWSSEGRRAEGAGADRARVPVPTVPTRSPRGVGTRFRLMFGVLNCRSPMSPPSGEDS